MPPLPALTVTVSQVPNKELLCWGHHGKRPPSLCSDRRKLPNHQGHEREDVVETIRIHELGALKPFKMINGQYTLKDHAEAMTLTVESRA